MNLKEIFYTIFSLWFGLFIAYIFWKIILKDLFYKIVLYRRGVVTIAELSYVLDSAIYVQYRPLFYMRFKFKISSGVVESPNIKVIINKKDTPLYHVGNKVKIKYDPKNLSNIKIVDNIL